MKAELFMVPAAKAICLPPTATLKDAADIFVQHVGSVVILDDTVVVGIVTKTDLVRGIFMEGKATTATVAEVMTKDVVSIQPDMQRDAIAEMLTKKKIHHATVKDAGGKFIGVLSAWDVVREAALDAKAFPYNREALLEQRPRVW